MIRRPAEGGDGGEQAALVALHREPLVRYFARRGVLASACEDLAHETFKRLFALEGRQGRTHIENAEAYIFQVAGSVLADHLRRSRVRRQSAHVSIDDVASPIEVLTPGRVLEGKQALAALEKALLELKPKTREMFLLNRLDGLTYTQIAVRFGVTPSAVEKHLALALAHLRRRVGGG